MLNVTHGGPAVNPVPLVRLVQYLDARDRRVVDHGFEHQVDLPLRRRLDVREGLRDDAAAARFLVDVEGSQQRLSIAEHVEEPASRAAAARELWPVIELGEVQHHRVAAAPIYRDRVAEMPVAFGAEE